LLGNAVRWDGGHKRDAVVVERLAPLVEWVPVCPELEVGMGVPREPVHLERAGDGVALLGNQSAADWTARMRAFSARRLRELAARGLCGFVLKQDSPSCGLERVELTLLTGEVKREGRGVFAAALLERFPGLPIEEESRLHDPALRERWLERVRAYRRGVV
jgi:uncharacterized protein YbbK (DUF523 family)